MAEKKKVDVFWIVNPSGTLHQVNKAHAQALLSRVGYRSATAAEVKKLKAANGRQTVRDRIAPEFSNEPVAIESE